MKVIFLDFDGVLNSQGSFLYETRRRKEWKLQDVKGPVNQTFCNVCASNLQYVLDQYKDAAIVISSTWREFYNLEWLKAKFKEYHIDADRIIDVTPIRPDGNRGQEIKQWLDERPEQITHYVIIDDNDWGISEVHGLDFFVRTSWETGMTFSHAVELRYKLSSSYAKKIKDEKTKSE